MYKTPRQHLGRGAQIAGLGTDLLLDKIAVTKHPTRIARKTSAWWTSLCMHLGLVPSQNKHAKMSPRELGWCWLWNRPRSMCQKVTVCRKLSWWNLRPGAGLRGPKTYHQDGNHATSKAKAAETKDKTETECDGDASTRRTGVTCRNGTTNHVNDGHPRVASASAVCAVPCSVAYDVICSFLPDRG